MVDSLKTISKALAGFLAGALVAWLMKKNIIIEDGISDALEVVMGAVITGVVVYLAPKNK